jgi:hypothetical protein
MVVFNKDNILQRCEWFELNGCLCLNRVQYDYAYLKKINCNFFNFCVSICSKVADYEILDDESEEKRSVWRYRHRYE